jgi:Ca-activated chloride channel family protein
MSLAWPWALAALLAVPLLFLVRWWMLRRRKRIAVRVTSIALIRAALPGSTSWRRRIPVILFATGLVLLGLGTTRPHASVLVPRNSTSILLAIDVSRSMCSADVTPNRLAAASEAAKQFVNAQPEGTRIGLVAFAGIAGLLVEPTTDKSELLKAIDGLRTGRGTAIGQAILTSIDAIAEINPDVVPTGADPSAMHSEPGVGYQPDTIVVLTDGRNTQGVDPLTAAEEASARRLRVYTIGFGTTAPAPMVCTAAQLSDGDFRRDPGRRFDGGPGGPGPNLDIDEETLSQVAKMTGGEYFRAQDAKELSAVLGDLPSNMVVQRRNLEITAWFVLPGTLLVLIGVALSVWWNRSQGLAVVRQRPDYGAGGGIVIQVVPPSVEMDTTESRSGVGRWPHAEAATTMPPVP